MSKKGRKSTSKADFDSAAAKELYNSLCDEEDPEIISFEGIAKIGELLEIDASADVRVLVLLWKLKAISKPGQISQDEFMDGLRNLNVSDANSLKAMLPALDPGFLDRGDFRDFYKFVFQFSREGTHKTIEKDVILALLPIVLEKNRAPHLEYFMTFLQNCSHQRITLDQWDSFLQFNYLINVNLSNAEDDGAWPLLLDEYVEWRRKQ